MNGYRLGLEGSILKRFLCEHKCKERRSIPKSAVAGIALSLQTMAMERDSKLKSSYGAKRKRVGQLVMG